MAHRRKLSAARYAHSLVEFRYPRAHRFWDDCGKLIASLEEGFPGLKCQGLEKDGFKFTGNSSGIRAASFYWDKATIVEAGRVDARLSEAVVEFWSVVQKGLSPENLARIGQRTWLVLEGTKKASADWLLANPIVQFDDRLDSAVLGASTSNGVVIRTVLEPLGRRLRLEVGTGVVEVPAPKASLKGIVVDADISIEAPAELPADCGAFVAWNLTYLREVIEPVFGTSRKK